MLEHNEHTSTECEAFGSLVDQFVSGELDESTRKAVERHCLRCGACALVAARIDSTRARIRAALSADPGAPDVVRARIRAQMRAGRTSSRRRRPWLELGAVAAIGLVASGVFWLESRSPARSVVLSADARAEAPILRVGLDHHLHCEGAVAVPERPLTVEAMEIKLGPEYAGLAEAVSSQLGGGITLVDAHRCSSNGRRFVHLILRGAGPIVSVLATARDASLAAVPNGARLDERGTRASVYDSPGWSVYIVSDDATIDPSALALALGPVVASVVEGPRTRV